MEAAATCSSAGSAAGAARTASLCTRPARAGGSGPPGRHGPVPTRAFPAGGGSRSPARPQCDPHLPKRRARQEEAVSEGSPSSEAATGMLSCKRSTAQGTA